MNQCLLESGGSPAGLDAGGKVPAALVDSIFRRFLRDHGQEIIAKHFELYLTLGESIVCTSYSDDGPDSNGQLFLVLNTESSFPLGIGSAGFAYLQAPFDTHISRSYRRDTLVHLPAPPMRCMPVGWR